jgi:3-hydroxybutyryl-CoA dehydrogenase
LDEAPEALAVAVSEVAVPMLGHEDVPYWCVLAQTAEGRYVIAKRDRAVAVGDPVSSLVDGDDLEVVGIIGSGVMGASIVELLLSRGHDVVWTGRTLAGLVAAKDRVLDRLGRVFDEAELDSAAGRLEVSDDYTALGRCDVVIEVVIEKMEPKKAILQRAEAFMRRDAMLATNTSGLSLDELSSVLERPEMFGALHFFNPATRMRLVETALCARTSEQTSRELDRFARALGKIPVRVASTPAFAVNRALMPLLNEAVRELEDEVADAASIDEAIRLGLNHPMGPLALADLIGLDVLVEIMDNLAERSGDDTYRPRPLLVQKVAAGDLGRKSGRGFYEYPR